MERRGTRMCRVSQSQWNILLDFLERHPSLARARGYNNSTRGRAESVRLWQELAEILNAEGSGATKHFKDWAVYVSNYKSKIKKIVSDINIDASATGGGPPKSSTLHELDTRFLALMGPGFGQTNARVCVNPFPDEQPNKTTEFPIQVEVGLTQELLEVSIEPESNSLITEPSTDVERKTSLQSTEEPVTLPQQTRRPRRYRSRPLAPLDEARRILAQVELQRSAAEKNVGDALHLIGQNLGRLADVVERYLSRET